MSNMRSRSVSIVVPVWGEYIKFLPECVESIRNQTIPDIEIIVSDKFDNLPAARNAGIKQSNREYILCLDVDDKLKPNAIERMLDEGGDIIAFDREDQYGNPHPLEDNFEEFDFRQSNRIIACSMFKRELWEKIGGYDEKMVDGYEDWDFWLRAVTAGYKVTPIRETLYIQNFREDSMIHDTAKKHIELKNYLLSK